MCPGLKAQQMHCQQMFTKDYKHAVTAENRQQRLTERNLTSSQCWTSYKEENGTGSETL